MRARTPPLFVWRTTFVPVISIRAILSISREQNIEMSRHNGIFKISILLKSI